MKIERAQENHRILPKDAVNAQLEEDDGQDKEVARQLHIEANRC